jgi:hypothetical protein
MADAPIEITERERRRVADSEYPYYVNVMEMVGGDDFDGQSMNLYLRSDGFFPDDWTTANRHTKPRREASLVCDLSEWR